MEQPGKRRQRGGRRRPPVRKQTMHLCLPPETIAKLHIIAQHDDKLVGDLIAEWANRRWQQIKRSRKMIRPGNRTQQAIRKWAESDVAYPDGLPLLDLVTELEGMNTITFIRERTRGLFRKARAKILNIRLARLPGVPRRIPRVNDLPPENRSR